MTHLHFNVRQAAHYTADDEGEDLDLSTLPVYARQMARDIMLFTQKRDPQAMRAAYPVTAASAAPATQFAKADGG